jgi:hypothetical protein
MEKVLEVIQIKPENKIDNFINNDNLSTKEVKEKEKLRKLFFPDTSFKPSPEQLKIIEDRDKIHMRILAGAGSGKTETVKNRFLFMISDLDCDPNDFFMVTFTKNAAKHLYSKLSGPLKLANKTFDRTQCGTFHALARRVLQKYNILDETLGKVYNIDELQYHFLNFLRQSTNNLQVQDFRSRIKHVFVDEFQDVNQVQYDIVKELARSCETVTIVGDDNQAIYQFRGSNVKFIHQFAEDFPTMKNYCLSVNFRSIPPIVNLANICIRHNKNQLPKLDSKSSQQGQQGSQNYYPLPKLINEENMFYGVINICNEIMKLIRLKLAFPNQICILSRSTRLLNTARAYLQQRSFKTLLYSGDDDFSKQYSYQIKKNSITLSTIHSSKGLEWERVYVVGLHDLYFPSQLEGDVDAERRLWYVAITRAKKHLTILNSLEAPSRFISENVSEWKKIFSFEDLDYDTKELQASIIAWDKNPKNPKNLLLIKNEKEKKRIIATNDECNDNDYDININTNSNCKKLKLSSSPVGYSVNKINNNNNEDARHIRWFGVVNIIRMLDGQDYINLKRDILPSSFLDALTKPVPPSTIYTLPNRYKKKITTDKDRKQEKDKESKNDSNDDDNDNDYDSDFDNDDQNQEKKEPIRTIFPYHNFIASNQMEPEFGQYLDLFIRRLIAEHAWDRFQKEKEKDKNRKEGEPSVMSVMTEEEIMKLFLDVDAERCATEKGDRIKSVPQHYQLLLKQAYIKYKNPLIKTLDIIDFIYLLSFCNAIVKGKQYVLYVPVDKLDLLHYREMYLKMQQQIVKLIGNKKVNTAVPIEYFVEVNGQGKEKEKEKKGLRGIIDLLIDDNIIIDFKNTLYESQTCRIDFLLQVLGYASIINNKHKNLHLNHKNDNNHNDSNSNLFHFPPNLITHVGIYNIIADCIFIIDINGWKNSDNLFNLLINKK